MKKNSKTSSRKKIEFDLELLKHWKGVSNKGKLDFMESALRFAKLRKF